MSIHDTYVTLKSDSPFQEIMHLFPEGLPMRDPFPMEYGHSSNGEPVALWMVDMARLSDEQISALATVIANGNGVSLQTILEDCKTRGGFFVNNIWIDSMFGGAENYRRTIEWLGQSAAIDQADSDEVANDLLNEFFAQQYRDWIIGDRIPEPMPENYEDVNPRLKSPKLEEAYKQIEIHKFLDNGNYSVFDVLSGKAMVDALNQIDPENDWELATD